MLTSSHMSRSGDPTDGLVLRGVSARYRDRTVLERVDMQLHPGEVVALVGDNGSGKTTTLAVAAGLLPPAGGQVTWQGRPMRLSDRALRTQVGVSLGKPPTDRRLPVGAVLALHARLHGEAPDAPARRALLGDLGLLAVADTATAALSTGYRQRLAFALAAAHRPRLMILDEPLATVDADGAEVLRAEVDRAATDGCAVLYAAHEADGLLPRSMRLRVVDGTLQDAGEAVPELDELLLEVEGDAGGARGAVASVPGVHEVVQDGSRLTVRLSPGAHGADRALRARVSRAATGAGTVVTELRAAGERVRRGTDE